MAHQHHHEEKRHLQWFASPLHEGGHQNGHHSTSSDGIELMKPEDPHTASHVPFESTEQGNPSFHRHAEATTAELFYDLFFVANLTTFTSVLEINNKTSLTSYIGFFSLLWLTWYQVSLFDIRFSSDSVFERVCKAIHFGVMVGFAVIGPQWHPGQYIDEFKMYRIFGLTLLVSRLTLALQYAVTLWYTKKYTKTILPLSLVIGSTLLAAILYGALTPAFPKEKFGAPNVAIPQKSNVYIAWYVIALCETSLTVAVSCFYRVISFKGTHMVQRMSLLTLIILGEGIIVVCKAISKIVKNEFLWTPAVIGQIVASIMIIYFLYMLYFDRLHEEHFGSIKQQIWSFGHFPLHITLVLVLQGVSLLIIWKQALQGLSVLYGDMIAVQSASYTSGAAFAKAMNNSAYDNVYDNVPKGVDASKELKTVNTALYRMADAWDFIAKDGNNKTAAAEYTEAINNLLSATTRTLFDTLSVSIPKGNKAKENTSKQLDYQGVVDKYVKVFSLIFSYVFITAGLALSIIAILGFLSLPLYQRNRSHHIRLAVNLFCGIGLALVATLRFEANLKTNFMSSAWMIPTIVIVYFVCVVANHVGLTGGKRSRKSVMGV